MAAGQAAEWSANGKVGRELRAREAVATGYCHHQCPGWRQPKGLCGAQKTKHTSHQILVIVVIEIVEPVR